MRENPIGNVQVCAAVLSSQASNGEICLDKNTILHNHVTYLLHYDACQRLCYTATPKETYKEHTCANATLRPLTYGWPQSLLSVFEVICAYEHIFLIVRYRYISFKQL